MADLQINDGQIGYYGGAPQGQPFPLEADVSRLVFGSDYSDPQATASDIITDLTTQPFQPRFNNLGRPVEQPRIVVQPGQVQIPRTDLSQPSVPCVTQPCSPYESFTPGTIVPSQLRPEDIARIVMTANQGYVEQYDSQPWNNPQYPIYQPGRVPPSQVQPYDVVRALFDQNYVDDRGYRPQDYPNDPRFRGQRLDPRFPHIYDAQSGQIFNPRNNTIYDLNSGQVFDARTGLPIDPTTGRPFDPRFAQNRNYNQNHRYRQSFIPPYMQQGGCDQGYYDQYYSGGCNNGGFPFGNQLINNRNNTANMLMRIGLPILFNQIGRNHNPHSYQSTFGGGYRGYPGGSNFFPGGYPRGNFPFQGGGGCHGGYDNRYQQNFRNYGSRNSVRIGNFRIGF